jgi:hypothetical protein
MGRVPIGARPNCFWGWMIVIANKDITNPTTRTNGANRALFLSSFLPLFNKSARSTLPMGKEHRSQSPNRM